MNERQRRFIDAYLIDPNATKAAEAAGYSKRTAGQIGDRLLKEVEIAEEIARRQAERAQQAKLTSYQVLDEIDTLASSDVGQLFDLTADDLRMLPMREWPADARRAVGSVKVKVYPMKELPPISADEWQRLEDIANGKAYAFDISRAILPEDQIFMRGLVERMRALYWGAFEIREVKLWDKNSALDKAAKHRGMFTEKVEITGKDGAPLMPLEAAREAVAVAEKRGLTLVKDDGKRRVG